MALLEQTLEEEEAADKKLTMLAEGSLNEAALAEGEEEGARQGREAAAGSRRQSAGNPGGRAKAADRSRR